MFPNTNRYPGHRTGFHIPTPYLHTVPGHRTSDPYHRSRHQTPFFFSMFRRPRPPWWCNDEKIGKFFSGVYPGGYATGCSYTTSGLDAPLEVLVGPHGAPLGSAFASGAPGCRRGSFRRRSGAVLGGHPGAGRPVGGADRWLTTG